MATKSFSLMLGKAPRRQYAHVLHTLPPFVLSTKIPKPSGASCRQEHTLVTNQKTKLQLHLHGTKVLVDFTELLLADMTVAVLGVGHCGTRRQRLPSGATPKTILIATQLCKKQDCNMCYQTDTQSGTRLNSNHNNTFLWFWPRLLKLILLVVIISTLYT